MPNIKLSKLAKKVIYQTIKECNIPSGKGLRLEDFEGVLALTTDSPTKCDRIIKRNNNIILLVNKSLEKKLGASYIDIDISCEEPRLVIFCGKGGNKVETEFKKDNSR